MVREDFTKLSGQPTVAEIAGRLQMIAAQLAGFKPTIDMVLEDVDKGVGDSLNLLGGVADYLNRDISILAEQLDLMSRQPT